MRQSSFTQQPQKQGGIQQVRPTTPPSKTFFSPATTGSKNVSFAPVQEPRKISSTAPSSVQVSQTSASVQQRPTSVQSRLSTPTSAQQRLNTVSTVQQRLALASSQTVHQPSHTGSGLANSPTNQPTTLPSLSQRLTAAQTSSRIVPSSVNFFHLFMPIFFSCFLHSIVSVDIHILLDKRF